MPLLDKIKKVLFKEDTISYEFVVKNMKKEIEKLENDYKQLIALQENIKNNPFSILKMNFNKKDKYIDAMENIKYEDIGLIKQHELIAMKYNILVELYNKLKNYVSKQRGHILVDFNTDKFKQPVAILSLYENDLRKIILIKNTFHTESYLIYDINDNVEIKDIYLNEHNVNHASFMMEMLYKTLILLKEKGMTNVNKIVLSKELVKKLQKNDTEAFLSKHNFKQSGEEFYIEI